MQLIKNEDIGNNNKKSQKDQSTTMSYKDDNNKNRPIDGNKNIDDQLNNDGSQKNNQNSIKNNEVSEKGEDQISGTKQSDTGVNEKKRYHDEIEPDDKNKTRIGKFVQKILGRDKKSEQVAISTEYSGNSSNDFLYHTLTLAKPTPGEYHLNIEVIDLNNYKKTIKRRTFTLRDNEK